MGCLGSLVLPDLSDSGLLWIELPRLGLNAGVELIGQGWEPEPRQYGFSLGIRQAWRALHAYEQNKPKSTFSLATSFAQVRMWALRWSEDEMSQGQGPFKPETPPLAWGWLHLASRFNIKLNGNRTLRLNLNL
jgi:hypothetical protein